MLVIRVQLILKKVPAMDLPKALDAALKALLSSHSISSFKVDDSRHSPAVIIRLSPLCVPSVCKDGVPERVVSTTVYRKKPPSQVNRDKRRMDNFIHRSTSDRVKNQTVNVTDISLPVKEGSSNMRVNHCYESDKKCTVETKERDSHVDTPCHTGVTLEGATDGEVSVPAEDAGSEAATLSTHPPASAGVAVSKDDTIRKEVASNTSADPRVKDRAHEEKRAGKIEKDSNSCRGGQSVVQKDDLEKCDDNEWIDIGRWRDEKPRKKKDVLDKTREDVRRSKREGRGIRERDK